MNNAWRRPNPVFSEEYRALRETILDARRRAGITQRELAKRIGKTPSHVACIERGERRIDTLEFYRIARALGLSPAALFTAVAEQLDALGHGEPTYAT